MSTLQSTVNAIDTYAIKSAGTSGQVWTSGGSGAGSWQAPGGAQWEVITPILPSQMSSSYLYMFICAVEPGSSNANSPSNSSIGNGKPVGFMIGGYSSTGMSHTGKTFQINADNTMWGFKNDGTRQYGKITNTSSFTKMWRMSL